MRKLYRHYVRIFDNVTFVFTDISKDEIKSIEGVIDVDKTSNGWYRLTINPLYSVFSLESDLERIAPGKVYVENRRDEV